MKTMKEDMHKVKDALRELDEGLSKEDSSVRVAEIAKKKGIR